MTVYCVFDANGSPEAFYPDSVFPNNEDGTRNSAIPDTAVEVTEDDHSLMIANNGLAKYVGGKVSVIEHPAEPFLAFSISKQQFYQQLAVAGLCTEDEALSAVTSGVLPPRLLQIVVSLPAVQQFAAKMTLTNSTFYLTNPLVKVVQTSMQWTDEQVQAFWSAASEL